MNRETKNIECCTLPSHLFPLGEAAAAARAAAGFLGEEGVALGTLSFSFWFAAQDDN